MTIKEKLADADKEIRGDGLPDNWTPAQWVSALTYKLGQVAFYANAYNDAIDNDSPYTASAMLNRMDGELAALSVVAQHAMEALNPAS